MTWRRKSQKWILTKSKKVLCTAVEINVLYQLSYGWWGIWAWACMCVPNFCTLLVKFVGRQNPQCFKNLEHFVALYQTWYKGTNFAYSLFSLATTSVPTFSECSQSFSTEMQMFWKLLPNSLCRYQFCIQFLSFFSTSIPTFSKYLQNTYKNTYWYI